MLVESKGLSKATTSCVGEKHILSLLRASTCCQSLTLRESQHTLLKHPPPVSCYLLHNTPLAQHCVCVCDNRLDSYFFSFIIFFCCCFDQKEFTTTQKNEHPINGHEETGCPATAGIQRTKDSRLDRLRRVSLKS